MATDERLARAVTSELNHQKHAEKVSTNFCQAWAAKIVGMENFDHFMGVAILANLVVMIVEVDRQASLDESDDSGMHWTEVFGWVVLAIFVLELVLRIIAFRMEFFHDAWHIGDFLIVVIDMIFSIVGVIAGQTFPKAILRVFRMAKLARVSKLLRVFPELRMLLAGFVHSLRAIFWGALLLGVSLIVWSMVAVLVIHPLNKDMYYPPGCDRCNRAFSSVFQAMLTFWQQIVTGDSWGTITIPLIEEYPATAFFFIPVFLSIGLSVMNLMLAVVVNAAQSAYENEGQLEEAEKKLHQARHQNNVIGICKHMDKDGSGELAYDEVLAGFQEEGEFRDALLALNISDEDFNIAWSIIDLDHSGSVSYNELISFLFKMKDSDMHFTLTYIKSYITWVKNALSEQMNKQQAESKKIQKTIQSEMAKVEEQEKVILNQERAILEEVVLAKDSDGGVDIETLTSTNPTMDKRILMACPKTDSLTIPNIDFAKIDQSGRGPMTPAAEPGQSWPYVRAGIDAKAGMPTSVKDALLELVQQFSHDFGRMHLELNGILTGMNRNLSSMDGDILSKIPIEYQSEYAI